MRRRNYQAARSSCAPTTAPASTSARSSTSASAAWPPPEQNGWADHRPGRWPRDRAGRDRPGPATSSIGFMTWEGYNYEDAVLHERAPCPRGRITPPSTLRSMSLTHAIPSSGRRRSPAISPTSAKTRCKDLDERGIIRVGAEVHAGDILVGKVTPKGETELTAEERLLRAIFGEKAREVRDTSLKVPHGESGIVVDVQGFHARERATSSAPASTWSCASISRRRRKISAGRQDGRPSRQQGRCLPHPAAGGYALHAGRHAA